MAYAPVPEAELTLVVDKAGRQITVDSVVIMADAKAMLPSDTRLIVKEVAKGTVSEAYFVRLLGPSGRIYGWTRVNYLRLVEPAAPPPPKDCTCDITAIMRDGCTCGATKKYQQNELIT